MIMCSQGPLQMDRRDKDIMVNKRRKIEACLRSEGSGSIDLWELRELALSKGGLVDAELRQQAWPLLVGMSEKEWCDAVSLLVSRRADSTTTDQEHDDDTEELNLIRREAGRSVLFRFLREDTSELVALKEEEEEEEEDSLSNTKQQEHELQCVLESTVVAGNSLTPRQGKIHYYQGLHDVAGVLLYNLQDPSVACAVLRRICASHLRDALRTDFSQLLWLLKVVLLPLLKAVDNELHDFMVYCEVELPNVVLPWLITWFSHDTSSAVAGRLADAFLASHCLFPLYVAVALLANPSYKYDLYETESDPAMVHMALQSKVKSISETNNEGEVTTQDLIDDALTIMRRHPPRSLLHLAEEYNGGNTTIEPAELRKAEFISLLKAPPSWALASRALRFKSPDSSSHSPTSVLSLPHVNFDDDSRNSHARAKVASGVEWLMSTIDERVGFSERGIFAQIEPKQLAATPQFRPIGTIWVICQRILLFVVHLARSKGNKKMYD